MADDIPIFRGGWIDLQGLVRGLAGWPLLADIEEIFTPHSGGEPLRRSGRLFKHRDGRVRMDVSEGDGPAFMFAVDPVRRCAVGGLADQPETWHSAPFPALVVPARPRDTPPPAEFELGMEFEDAKGRHRYRVYNARYEDPPEGTFPEDGATPAAQTP